MHIVKSIHHKRHITRPARFTLLELLVVIGTIAILMSLLLPALSKVKETGRGITCSKNLKQLCESYNMYVDDNNGWLTDYDTSKYLYRLLPYIAPNCSSPNIYMEKYQERAIYHCPSATTADSWCGSLYSYGLNEHMNSGEISPTYWFLQKVSKVISPSRLTLFTDSDYPLVRNTDHLSNRHRNGINVIYFDGHCIWISRINAMNTMTASNFTCWFGRSNL